MNTHPIRRRPQHGLAAWGALLENRNLLVFPGVAALIMGVLAVLSMTLVVATGLFNGLTRQSGAQVTLDGILWMIGVLVVYRVINKLIGIYISAALVGATLMQGRDQRPTVIGGLRAANAHLPTIAFYALLTPLINRYVRNSRAFTNGRSGAAANQLPGLSFGRLWNGASYLVMPIMIAENLGILGAIERSIELFMSTWGENIFGRLTLGIETCLLRVVSIVPGVLLLIVGLGSQSLLALYGGAIVLLASLSAVAMFNNATSAIFQASLYNYSVNHHGAALDTQLMATAFNAR